MSSCNRGITINVTAETNLGGKRHMEDYIAVNLAPSVDSFNEVGYLREQAYVGVFDGHGGREAAKCASERLWETIQNQPKFRSSDLKCVIESIKEGFVALHKEMEPQRAQWKRNKVGDLSTAGTTASTVIFRQDHIIVANVGDSTAVLAVSNPEADQEGQHPVMAKTLTKDHKPEDPSEMARIRKHGGQVMLSRKRIHRVVWQRERKLPRTDDSPPDPTTPVVYDAIPFLNVARSLGDFWSYSPTTNEFIVSPCPDVTILPLQPKEQKFLVVASDGLWNVMSPTQVVQFIWDYEQDDQTCHQPRDVVRAVIKEALKRWRRKNLIADNIAVLIAFLSEEEAVPHMPTSIVTKIRHRRKASPVEADSSQSPCGSKPVCELTRRKRKRNKLDEEIASPTKKTKLELTDSGLEMDCEPLDSESTDAHQTRTEDVSESVVEESSEKTEQELSSCKADAKDDESSGVSSDDPGSNESSKDPKHKIVFRYCWQ